MADTCKSCKFYLSFWTAKGKCRRFPPQVVNEGGGGILGGDEVVSKFPNVNPADWCGEFKQKG